MPCDSLSLSLSLSPVSPAASRSWHSVICAPHSGWFWGFGVGAFVFLLVCGALASVVLPPTPEPFLVSLFTLHVPCICLCAQARTSSSPPPPVLHRLRSWVRPSAPARVQFLALLAPALCWGCVKVRVRVLWAWFCLRPYGLWPPGPGSLP